MQEEQLQQHEVQLQEEVQAHEEHVQQEEVQVQEEPLQQEVQAHNAQRPRTGGVSEPGREVHRRHALVTDKVVVRPRPAADIEGRLVTEHELVRYIVSGHGAREVVWQTATVIRMFRSLQTQNPTFYNVKTSAGVLCSKQLLPGGGWQVWRRNRWWEPEEEDLPGPDVQGQQE